MASTVSGVTSPAGTVLTDTSKSALGKDAFLKLLVAQLSNQDPLKPVEDKEFISQLAQFSSLEQMQAVSQGVDTLNGTTKSGQLQSTFLQGVSLVGKNIEVPNPAYDGDKVMDKTVTGKVDSVDFRGSEPILRVGKNAFYLSSVLSVS
jgi:flagellar basal-body rod modification protein FlgD